MWGRFDDNFPHHPKARRAGVEACWLFVCGVLHCNRFATDGAIAALDLDVLYPSAGWTPKRLRDLAAKLVEVGLWEVTEGGWRVHDYAEYQREAMRDARDERRKWEADRKARQREAKKAGGANAGKSQPPEECPGGTGVGQHHGTGVGQSRGTSMGQVPPASSGTGGVTDITLSQPPVPSRPVPSQPKTEDRQVDEPAATPDASGAVAPLSLLPSEAPKPDPVAEVFAHWQSATGRKGAKLDTKRRALIARTLKGRTVAELCRCVDGYASSPFHRGENDRGTKYLDLELMLRDAAKIEAGLELAATHAPSRPAVAPSAPSSPSGRPPAPAPVYDRPDGPVVSKEYLASLKGALAKPPAQEVIA